MQKRTLFLAAALLILALVSACYINKNTIWTVSAFVPFLGLSAVTENSRSMVYAMSELEMSARFSLRSVILARMGFGSV